MDNNINFKDLWSKQTSLAPNPENLIADIKKMKQSNLRKLVFTNILLIATSIFIISIWIHYQPQFLTTKIGIILTILAMAVFLFSYNNTVSYTHLRAHETVLDIVCRLLLEKKKQNIDQCSLTH